MFCCMDQSDFSEECLTILFVFLTAFFFNLETVEAQNFKRNKVLPPYQIICRLRKRSDQVKMKEITPVPPKSELLPDRII